MQTIAYGSAAVALGLPLTFIRFKQARLATGHPSAWLLPKQE